MLLKAVLNCCRYKSSVVCFCLGSGFSDSCDYAYMLFNCLCLCVSQKQETEKLNFWIVYSCDRCSGTTDVHCNMWWLDDFLGSCVQSIVAKDNEHSETETFIYAMQL